MPNKNANILSMDLTPTHARRILTEIKTSNPEKIRYTIHVEERMVERGISRIQIERCIEHGKIIEGPYRDERSNWKFKLETFSAGDLIRVVAVLDRDEDGRYCVVITVF